MTARVFFAAALVSALTAFAAEKNSMAQWDAGMDDDAGMADATSLTALPKADFANQWQGYAKRDRFHTLSLDGTGNLPEAKAPIAAPVPVNGQYTLADLLCDNVSYFLRIDRKKGLDRAIQIMGKRKAYDHGGVCLLKPQVLEKKPVADGVAFNLKWTLPEGEDYWFEGTVKASLENATTVKYEYELKPSEKCRENSQFVELGLVVTGFSNSCSRVDWVGNGILTSVPGKSKMNVFGTWSMHKDDYRFPGNRSGVKWASIGWNGRRDAFVLESGTGNVDFDVRGNDILLTENLAVAGYGGKSSGPSGLKSVKEMELKGSFRVWSGMFAKPRAVVVPDLTYTYH